MKTERISISNADMPQYVKDDDIFTFRTKGWAVSSYEFALRTASGTFWPLCLVSQAANDITDIFSYKVFLSCILVKISQTCYIKIKGKWWKTTFISCIAKIFDICLPLEKKRKLSFKYWIKLFCQVRDVLGVTHFVNTGTPFFFFEKTHT